MRLLLRSTLPIPLLLIVATLLPVRAQVQRRPLPLLQRTMVFAWPSTLRVAETVPIRVVPGDLVELKIPSEEATRGWTVIYDCRWEEKKKKGGIFGLFAKEVTEEQRRRIPVQLQLGEQIRFGVKIPGNPSRQLTQAQPSLQEVVYEPGQIAIAATVSTALPQKPHPRAVCNPTPLPSGEPWYRVSVRITRFQ